MKRNFNKGQGFTLIEMMIVMLVIIVLAGMVFKLMGVAGAKNEEANTKATLQKVANALEEYRAIYGKYPPVYSYPGLGQPVRYEYANERYLEVEVGPDFAQYLKNASAERDIWSDELLSQHDELRDTIAAEWRDRLAAARSALRIALRR